VAERQDSDREVLTSLPRSRPVRRSAKRGDPDAAKNGAEASAQAPPRRSAAAKPRAAKTSAAGAAKTTARRAAPKPKRKVPPAGYAAPTGGRPDDGVVTGTAELIGTTIQAAAELAQIGLTVGRQTLQSMFDRLPKP
jgi:hypothetical protein